MTTAYIDPKKLDKFLYQNGAELLEWFDGCLQDNALYQTDNGGILAIYEHYLNCWSSDLYIEFGRHEPEKTAIYNRFIERMQEAERATA